MKLNFPATADTFFLPLTVAERNALENNTPPQMGDVLYSLMAIEQFILANTPERALLTGVGLGGTTYTFSRFFGGTVNSYLPLAIGWMPSGDQFQPTITRGGDGITLGGIPDQGCTIAVVIFPAG